VEPTLRPWREVAVPQRDIADGSFSESLFAADLGGVAAGAGPRDYSDAASFASKTYLTDSLAAVLVELAGRLSGDESASSVYRLQTEFGGGKTHTLLAAYHLFGDPAAVEGTPLARDLAGRLPGGVIPRARVVVLDGSHLLAGPQEVAPGRQAHTLLGHLAWGLGGVVALDAVAEQDRWMRGSSTAQLAALLAAHAPCVVLLDEMLEYLNKALEVRAFEGNLAATTLTIVKELASAAAQTPRTALVATLTSSRMEDYATVAGQEMQERLARVVGRSESIVSPVEGDDIFPILHRRLFADAGGAGAGAVAAAYASYYESLGDVLPGSFREAAYRDRLAAAYPFHPELVDICTNRWGSLTGFQRTRGALRILAHTVKSLWQRRDGAPLIHLGDLPLDDPSVRSEVLRFAGDSYKSALNADINRPDSKAPEEDRRRGGAAASARLAVGLATTAFAHSHSADRVVGASAAQMLLGVGRPGLSRGLVEDVRDSLESSLWYMRYEGGRYRFTTEPNLNKVIVEREAAVDDREIDDLVRRAVAEAAPSTAALRVITRVQAATDVPDEPRLTLGLLDTSARLGGEHEGGALDLARQVLETRGGVYRTNRNAVVLAAADEGAVAKARGTARTLAAMIELQSDRHRLGRFNAEQRERLDKRTADARQRLPQQAVMAYRYLLLLREANGDGQVLDKVDLGPARVGTTITDRVAEHLRGADRLLDGALAPAALLSDRFGVLPAGADAVELDALLGYFARYPRLPKLADPSVLRGALVAGVRQGLFALASGSRWDSDDAVVRFAVAVDPAEVLFQPGTHLVRAAAAQALLDARSGREDPAPPYKPDPPDPDPDPDPDQRPPDPRPPVIDRPPPPRPPADDAGGPVTVTLTGVPAAHMRDLVKVAVLPFTADSAEVTVDVVVRAVPSTKPISRNTIDLVVGEGLRQLGLAHDIHVDDGRDASSSTTVD